VLLATGYRPLVPYLAGCTGPYGRSALDETGCPVQDRGVSTTVPGLGYVGLEGQRGIASATLRGVGRDAEHVVRRLLADVRAAAPVGTR
jgi:putative flavoprotein involved in K+ transport